jgi:hypothetical protein
MLRCGQNQPHATNAIFNDRREMVKPKHFSIVVLFCFGIFILFISFLLIKGLITFKAQSSVESARIYQPAPTPGSDIHALEANAGIKIPSNASEIYGLISGFRDLVTYVRFDLPYSDLSSFIQNTHCKEPLKNTDPAKYSPGESEPDWWQPDKASELQECSGQEDNLTQRILVDISKPEKLTINVQSITSSSTGKAKP